MATSKTMLVQGNAVGITIINNMDYISLTDMSRNFDGGTQLIEKWLRNKNTIEFLGIWEKIYNPGFNSPEFGGIMLEAGLNRFSLSVKQWNQKVNGIGLVSRAGRYGSGTYAQKDIAFEYGSWLSPEFKLYMIREFQRLKEEESNRMKQEWNLQRTLSKINYRIHTDAIQDILIPKALTKEQRYAIYANEADLLNVALFGQTAARWKETAKNIKGNLRDHATIEQLIILTNLESLNAVFIKQGLSSADRLQQLNQIAISQMKSLLNYPQVRLLKSEKPAE